jgi:hypothetical protein
MNNCTQHSAISAMIWRFFISETKKENIMPLVFTNPIFGIGFIIGYALYKELNKE